MKIKDYFLTQEDFAIQNTEIDGILKTFPIPKNINKYYESEKYISYYQDNFSIKEIIYKIFQKFNLRYKKSIILKNIIHQKLCENISILDYGCGSGEFIKYMSKDFSTYAFEPNIEVQKIAQNKSKKTKFIHHLSEFKNNHLDVITLWHVFEHIEERDKYLEIFYQKLKTNGLLILALPNYQSYDAKKYKNFWAAYDVPRHIWHYSKKGIENLINANDWKIKNISPLLLDAFYISILSEKYKKNPFFLFSGIFQGTISNFKASKTGEFSSLIYILQKK